METQKKTRIAAAITVNVIILAVILAAVIIYQLVEIAAVQREKKRIENEIKYYTEQIEKSQTDLEYVKSEQYLLDYAFLLGYYYPNH